jgi:hypothetical protein
MPTVSISLTADASMTTASASSTRTSSVRKSPASRIVQLGLNTTRVSFGTNAGMFLSRRGLRFREPVVPASAGRVLD